MAYDFRLMNEAALPLLDQIGGAHTTNLHQSEEQAKNEAGRPEYLQKLGSSPATTWRNLSELDQIVTDPARRGPRRESRPSCSSGPIRRKKPVGNHRQDRDLAASSGRARPGTRLWRKATSMPRPGIQDARIGTTYLVEGDFDAARRHYQQAIKADPALLRPTTAWPSSSRMPAMPAAHTERRLRALEAAQDDTRRSAARAIAAARRAVRAGSAADSA